MGQVRQPLGASSAKELSWHIIIQSNFCSCNCKRPGKCNGINLTYELSELVLQPKNDSENVVLNCPSFRLACRADIFFELLLGLHNPLMPNKMSHPYQTAEPVLNQRANIVTFIKFFNLLTISGDHNQTPHSAASDLGLYCVLMTKRKALGLYRFTGVF